MGSAKKSDKWGATNNTVSSPTTMNRRFQHKAEADWRPFRSRRAKGPRLQVMTLKSVGLHDVVVDKLIELRSERFVIALQVAVETEAKTVCLSIRGIDQRHKPSATSNLL